MEIFGKRVKHELNTQGKKQKDLCEHLNIKKTTLSSWLNDVNEPPMDMIVAIALYLDVTTDYLLGLED